MCCPSCRHNPIPSLAGYCTTSLPLFLQRGRGISLHPLLHQRERRKRSSPSQSHAWAQRKSSRVGHKERQSIGMPCAASSIQPSLTPINLKVERFWGRKSTRLQGKVGEPWITLVPERLVALLQQPVLGQNGICFSALLFPNFIVWLRQGWLRASHHLGKSLCRNHRACPHPSREAMEDF